MGVKPRTPYADLTVYIIGVNAVHLLERIVEIFKSGQPKRQQWLKEEAAVMGEKLGGADDPRYREWLENVDKTKRPYCHLYPNLDKMLDYDEKSKQAIIKTDDDAFILEFEPISTHEQYSTFLQDEHCGLILFTDQLYNTDEFNRLLNCRIANIENCDFVGSYNEFTLQMIHKFFEKLTDLIKKKNCFVCYWADTSYAYSGEWFDEFAELVEQLGDTYSQYFHDESVAFVELEKPILTNTFYMFQEVVMRIIISILNGTIHLDIGHKRRGPKCPNGS